MKQAIAPKLSRHTLIKTYKQLHRKDSNYVEILPGHFKEKWWNENSIYIEEDIFIGYVMDFIIKRFPSYYLYEVCEITSYVWQEVIKDIEMSKNASEYIDLIAWINTKAKRHAVISILGM